MTRHLVQVTYQKWVNPEIFLECSLERFKKTYPEVNAEGFEDLIGVLMADVMWFPYGEFSARDAIKRLAEANTPVTEDIEDWFYYTQNKCNSIKIEVAED